MGVLSLQIMNQCHQWKFLPIWNNTEVNFHVFVEEKQGFFDIILELNEPHLAII